MDFKASVERERELADACLEGVRASVSDFDAVYAGVRACVLHRYLLEEGDVCALADPDDLEALAAASNAKRAARHHAGALGDTSSGCTGVSSAVTKKVLLAMAIRRALGIEGHAEAFGAALTVADLAHAVQDALSS